MCAATADFDVVEVLGSGSFSTVFKIHSKGPDQGVYVLKETRKLSTSETTQAHVAREVEMLLLSRGCPGIVQYHASFVEQDSHYTVRTTLPPIAVSRYMPPLQGDCPVISGPEGTKASGFGWLAGMVGTGVRLVH